MKIVPFLAVLLFSFNTPASADSKVACPDCPMWQCGMVCGKIFLGDRKSSLQDLFRTDHHPDSNYMAGWNEVVVRSGNTSAEAAQALAKIISPETKTFYNRAIKLQKDMKSVVDKTSIRELEKIAKCNQKNLDKAVCYLRPDVDHPDGQTFFYTDIVSRNSATLSKESAPPAAAQKATDSH